MIISNRVQIKEALLTICDNVKMEYPEGQLNLPLVTYAEITNAMVSKREARMDYQIDAYTGSFEDMINLIKDIDNVMTGMGWSRNYVTPDSSARAGAGLYHKAINYTARIDTLRKDII